MVEIVILTVKPPKIFASGGGLRRRLRRRLRRATICTPARTHTPVRSEGEFRPSGSMLSCIYLSYARSWTQYWSGATHTDDRRSAIAVLCRDASLSPSDKERGGRQEPQKFPPPKVPECPFLDHSVPQAQHVQHTPLVTTTVPTSPSPMEHAVVCDPSPHVGTCRCCIVLSSRLCCGISCETFHVAAWPK